MPRAGYVPQGKRKHLSDVQKARIIARIARIIRIISIARIIIKDIIAIFFNFLDPKTVTSS